MDADAALIEAWTLGEDEDGWSDRVMERAEALLPILIEAGYAEATGRSGTSPRRALSEPWN
jgi:hypothetical protein